jgi:hypothetical protein
MAIRDVESNNPVSPAVGHWRESAVRRPGAPSPLQVISYMDDLRPNFFVVGAPRAGTTTLYNYLRQHPDIYVPKQKELHYFTREHAASSYYRPPVIRTEYEYLRHFSARKGQSLAGDFSPSYLYFEAAAQEILQFSSDARIIAILRNPTERTISHYLMDVAKGLQDKPLSAFYESTAENSLFHFEYVGASLYAEGVARYLRLFGPGRVHVIVAEELWANAESKVVEVLRFLGADPNAPLRPEGPANTYFEPRADVMRTLGRSSLARATFRRLPEPLQFALKALLQRHGGRKPEFVAERQYLDRRFADEVKHLSAVLGRDMAGVWNRERLAAHRDRRGPP